MPRYFDHVASQEGAAQQSTTVSLVKTSQTGSNTGSLEKLTLKVNQRQLNSGSCQKQQDRRQHGKLDVWTLEGSKRGSRAVEQQQILWTSARQAARKKAGKNIDLGSVQGGGSRAVAPCLWLAQQSSGRQHITGTLLLGLLHVILQQSLPIVAPA